MYYLMEGELISQHGAMAGVTVAGERLFYP